MKSMAYEFVVAGKFVSNGNGFSYGNSLFLYSGFMVPTSSGVGVPSTLNISVIYSFEFFPGKSGLNLNSSAMTQPADQTSILSPYFVAPNINSGAR